MSAALHEAAWFFARTFGCQFPLWQSSHMDLWNLCLQCGKLFSRTPWYGVNWTLSYSAYLNRRLSALWRWIRWWLNRCWETDLNRGCESTCPPWTKKDCCGFDVSTIISNWIPYLTVFGTDAFWKQCQTAVSIVRTSHRASEIWITLSLSIVTITTNKLCMYTDCITLLPFETNTI